MGTKYASQTVSGYNAAPPPDDGTAIAANKISWATIKTKLPDPILLLAQGINTELLDALDVSNTSQATAYTTLASDHQKPIEVSGGATIHLASAASVGVGYQVTVVNTDLSLSSTVDLALGANTFDGSVGGSAVLAPGQAITVAVNASINGYYTVNRGWGRGGFIIQEQVQFNAAISLNTNVSLTLAGSGAVAAGSSAAVGFTFSGDTDTGVGWISADVFGFYTAGQERARFSGGYFKASYAGTYNAAGTSHEFIKSEDSADAAVYIKHDGATATSQYGVHTVLAGDPNNGTNYFLRCTGNLTLRQALYSNGGRSGYTANDVNLSDAQAKILDGPSDDHTDFVESLDGLYQKTTYRDGDSGQFDSVTAQSIEAIAPELVTEFDSGLKGIYTQRFQDRINSVIPRLISRIKALEAR